MRSRHRAFFLLPGGPLEFPDPELCDDEGLVAVGGDLSVERLLLAYDLGIFPWYGVGLPPMWWSPNPRAILDPARLHISRSMRRVLRSTEFSVSWNRAFRQVMQECGKKRDGGTWILPEMITAYTRLHALGHAHSLEVWRDQALVGGIYGVQRGALFAAESMFHRESNGSKLALITCVRAAFRAGIELFDVQLMTPHLASLGVFEVTRHEYLERVARARHKCVDLANLDLCGRPDCGNT